MRYYYKDRVLFEESERPLKVIRRISYEEKQYYLVCEIEKRTGELMMKTAGFIYCDEGLEFTYHVESDRLYIDDQIFLYLEDEDILNILWAVYDTLCVLECEYEPVDQDK